MSIKTINGDITNAPVGTLICHQVNCQGVMGAGVALAIARKWPVVERDYEDYVRVMRERDRCPNGLLGHVRYADSRDGRIVANMLAQVDYGCGTRQTNYEAFYNCLANIARNFPHGKPIAFSYMIGCGLGGGNWNIIRTMIEEVLGDYDVTLYKFG